MRLAETGSEQGQCSFGALALFFQRSPLRRFIVATGNENVCRTCGKTGAAPYDELQPHLGRCDGSESGCRHGCRQAQPGQGR
jgi:hypothetical protein